MARYDSKIVEVIKEHIDIVDVISSYVKLTRAGRNYKGLCPFHGEKTASFSVSAQRQFYHCFGCGAGGDVISFVQQIESLDFIDAIELLADKHGIDLQMYISSERGYSSNAQSMDLNKKLIKINRAAAIYYYKNMPKFSIAMEYLIRRGLDRDTIREFGLGFAPDDWHYLHKMFDEQYFDYLRKAGLTAKSEKGNVYDYFRNRIMFPIKNIKGNVIAFGGRVMDDSMPKYLNSPETPIFHKSKTLYGLYQAKKQLANTRQVIVTEGYMDVIALYQNGIKNVVATLGTAFTKEHAKLLSRYADEIIICYDGDKAGINATLRTLNILDDVIHEVKAKIKILTLPNGMDPDELIRNKGKDEFLQIVKKARLVTEYRLDLAMEHHDLQTLSGRIDFANEAIDIIAKLNNSRVRGVYVDKIAPYAHLEASNMRKMVEEKHREFNIDNNYDNIYQNNKVNKSSIKSNANNPIWSLEYRLLEIALNGRENFYEILNFIRIDDFQYQKIQFLFEYLSGYYKNNEIFDARKAMEDIELQTALKLENIFNKMIPVDDIKAEVAFLKYKHRELILRQELDGIKFKIKTINDKKGLSPAESSEILRGLVKRQTELFDSLKAHINQSYK